MGNTPLGIAFPDDEDPIDVTASIKETAESVDAYLTPQVATVALAGSYSNTLIFTRVGPLVVLTGGVKVGGSPPSTSVVIGTLPPGMAPQSEAGSMIGSVYGTTITYQILVRPTGEITFRVSAPTGNTMNVNMVWAVG